ncbi:MAG: protein translocase subunit SecF [Acidimicrobiia bacterium]
MSPRADGRRHTLGDLFHERTNFQFIEHSRRWAILSGTMILIGLVGFLLNGGLNLGIDFEGGTSWQFTVAHRSPSSGAVRDVAKAAGVNDPKVLIVGGNTVRVQSKIVGAKNQNQVTEALAKYGNVKATEVSVSDVGPTWGNEVSKKAIQALIFFFVVIAGYLTLRFEWKMAGASIIAVIHDILITIGVYAITQIEVTPATVIAFLTILGYSLYDTVVVFDRVRENTASMANVRGETYGHMVNTSLNQTLMRSLNTSFVAVLPVASLLFVGSYLLGAVALRDFGLALFIGLMSGAYSSIFVAAPILAWWKEREPKYRALKVKATGRANVPARAAPAAGPYAAPVPAATATPAAVAVMEPEPGGTVEAPPAEPGPAQQGPPGPARAPRPRRQRGRKR